MSNRKLPAPDRLADVRARIKELQAQEAELRGEIVASADAQQGAAFNAEVRHVRFFRVDNNLLRKTYPGAYAKVVYVQEVDQVWLHPASTGDRR